MGLRTTVFLCLSLALLLAGQGARADGLDDNDTGLTPKQILGMSRGQFYDWYDRKIGGHRSNWRSAGIYERCQQDVIHRDILRLKSRDRLLVRIASGELGRWHSALMNLCRYASPGGTRIIGDAIRAGATRTDTIYHLVEDYKQLAHSDREARRRANLACTQMHKLAAEVNIPNGPRVKPLRSVSHAWPTSAKRLKVSTRRLEALMRRAPDRFAGRIAEYIESMLDVAGFWF